MVSKREAGKELGRLFQAEGAAWSRTEACRSAGSVCGDLKQFRLPRGGRGKAGMRQEGFGP